MSRDPVTFPDPESFNPARYLDPSYPTYKAPLSKYPTLMGEVGFGFGRRVCPGTSIAEDIMFVAIVSLMSKYTLRRRRNEQGVEDKLPWYEYVDGLPTQPAPFAIVLEERV